MSDKLRIIRTAIRKDSPLYVQFAVSKNCDLKCRMCQAVESRKDETELKLPDIERLAGILSELKVAVLVLTGGEPLLRKDLPEIVAAFTRRGISVRLQTNATLATDRRVEALVEAGLRDVTISLDTLDPERQDDINGSPGSWMRIMRGISVFSRHLPRKGSVSGLNIVVSRHNINEVPQLIKFATMIGFYASLIPVHLSYNGAAERGSVESHVGGAELIQRLGVNAEPIPSGAKDFIVRATSPDFAFTKEDHPLLDATYSKVIRMKKDGCLVYNSYRFLRESPDFLKYGKIHWKCDSPLLYFSISPQGNFLPCVDIKTDKSMLSRDFVSAYRSVEFREEIRDIVRRCPGCMYACWPEITYLCRDPWTFTERMLEGVRVSGRKRKPLAQEEILDLAHRLRDEPR